MSSSEAAIRVRDVSRHFLMFERPQDRLKQMLAGPLARLAGRPAPRYSRDFAALRGVSFEIRRGETVGIIGRNGSGKSTLLQIVCGTLRPSSGSIEVNGRVAALLELGAGFNPDFTGRENVYLNAAILGIGRAEAERRFEAIARFAEIGAFIDQPVKTYSSGMHVRLAFAVAINVDPDILVVDEALSVGDEAFQRKCFARIEEIRAAGGTILFVSHGAQTIIQLCDRALLLDGGELILEGRPKAVVGQYQRLANASPATAPDIRREIAARGRRVEGEKEGEGEGAHARFNSGGAPIRLDEDSAAEQFDPALLSRSQMVLEERGARIRDVRVTSLKGEQLNALVMGRRYFFRYTVEFTAAATHVGFGFSIKTMRGVAVGGFQTARARGLAVKALEANTKVEVRFIFRCLMTPGTYLADAGVLSMARSEGIVLHRVQDAVIFKVTSSGQGGETGLVDLESVAEWDFDTSNAMAGR